MLHNRWHVERGIVKPSCLLCTAERSDLIA
jgi:hypothetical protein